MIKVKRVEPIVLAVNSLDEAIPFYERIFGAKFGEKFTQTSARFAPFMLGQSYFELAEPVDQNGGVGRFLKNRGQGIWTITLQVDDINQAIAETKKQGVRILLQEMLPEPQKAISGVTWQKQMVFLHPGDTGGVLIILLESVEPEKSFKPPRGPVGLVKVNKVERFSIAAESFEPLITVFEKLFGIQPSPELVLESERYKYRFFNLGESSIEILVPTSKDSMIAKFLATRGKGIYHVTLNIEDLKGAITVLKAAGLPVFGPATYPPLPPFLSWSEAFTHPKHTFGVLFALAEIKREEKR